MAYNVPIGNWSEYVKKEVHEQDISNYIVGRNGGSDPAYGCYKNFTSTYQCGNGPNKTVSITGDKVEAGVKPLSLIVLPKIKYAAGLG